MVKGFVDTCKEAGTSVTGGQSVKNPFPMIGGCAIATKENPFIPVHAEPGNILVLTKPIGTQVAINAFQWMHSMPEKF